MTLRTISALLAGATLISGLPAFAQSYQGRDSGGSASSGAQEEGGEAGTRSGGRRLAVQPYIEASQILTAQLSPGDDVVTYTQLAAGVDASINGRRSAGTVSLRYERNFGWGNASDSDTITGIARGSFEVVPRTVTLEAGALAARTSVDGSGANVFTGQNNADFTTQTYSAYAGPRVQTRVDDVEVTGQYLIGYTRVESPDVVTANGNAVDVFDESVSQQAQARAGFAPGTYLPIGVGVGAGYFREDIDTLDQRVIDANVRADVTVPITPTFAIVGGVGYEDVEVSSRDAVRNANGVPILGPDGRIVTDEASPRVIAFESTGLIWDVGVMWRPSRRTSLQAGYGRRYDSDTFYGSFSFAPNPNTNLSIGAFDGIRGFGGRLTNSLASLPTDFDVVRDPITGAVVGCVNAVTGGSCLDGLLGSIRSSVFRSRGVAGNFSRRVGRYTAAISAGYEQREFIGAPGTVLAAANGVTDENYYAAGTVGGEIGRRGTFTVATYANWFEGGFGANDLFGLGSSASYSHAFTQSLSGRAAVAVNYLDSDFTTEDLKTASALVGLRYGF
ncbi:MAG: preprotein translocase subunit YajC [Pseudomonadota bacterium]|nr:preprotein translocase subunit YajC [Pseudomonadota bacterium]